MSVILDRRTFLRHATGAGVALATTGGLAPKTTAASSADQARKFPKSKPDVIVHRGGYPGWPWVTRAGRRLVCVFRDDGIHGFSPTGKILWTHSQDNGKTWAAAQVVVDEPEVDDRNAAVVQLPGGELLLCYNTYTKDRHSQCMITSSKDDGATWSAPTPMADLDARTRGAPIALSSGDLLVPIYRAPGNGSIAARSGDGGKSWRLVDIPGPKDFVGDEWVVLEVEPGRIVGIIRENGIRDGYFWKTESRDGGRRWDAAVRTNVRDARSTSPAHLDLHGKTPILTYADRRMISVSMVRPRDDAFLRWDVEGRLPCYQYRPDGKPLVDASYPVSVAVGPHRRLIVDYEIRPEGKWISGYFVDLPRDW